MHRPPSARFRSAAPVRCSFEPMTLRVHFHVFAQLSHISINVLTILAYRLIYKQMT